MSGVNVSVGPNNTANSANSQHQDEKCVDDDEANQPLMSRQSSSEYMFAHFSPHSPKDKKSRHPTGQLCAWGWGVNGQLGVGSLYNSLVPRSVKLPHEVSVKRVVCGTRFTILLSNSGQLWSFGKNDHGQLGLGDRNNRMQPTAINTAEFKGNVWLVDTRAAHVIAVCSNDYMYTWGRGGEGQLGHGTRAERLSPTRVRFKFPVKRASCGRQHTCCITRGGAVYATGCGDDGQLGRGLPVNSDTFQPVKGLDGIKISRVECGSRHSIALADDGTLYSWGGNSYGQCGIGNSINVMQPTQIRGIPPVWRIYTGYRHSLALLKNGAVYAFGWNAFSQLGLPDKGIYTVPTLVDCLQPGNLSYAALINQPTSSSEDTDSDLENHHSDQFQRMSVVDAALGGKHTLVIVRSSRSYNPGSYCSVLSFGQGDDGQLGHGTTSGYPVAKEIRKLRYEQVRRVGAGWQHSCAITMDPLDSNGFNKKEDEGRLFPIYRGDIDAFLALFMNSVIQVMLVETLCKAILGADSDIAHTRILPALGLLVFAGNLILGLQAKKIATETVNETITAQPFGINVVLLLSYTSLIIAPVMQQTGNAELAWATGLFACFITGLIECIGAFLMVYVRQFIPRSSMLASIGGIALTFIAMQFTFQVFANPAIAFLPLMIILISYGSGVKLPYGIPGALASVAVGIALAWISRLAGYPYWTHPVSDYEFGVHAPNLTRAVFPMLTSYVGWEHLSVILPMAIFNLVGNFVNIESAKSVGDNFPQLESLLYAGAGNMISALLGNPFPGCIFIGHPAFKSMGARLSYGVGNGIAIAGLCLINGGSLVLQIMPMEVAVGILFWVGVVMTSGAFEGGISPTKSFGVAVTVGFIPALAAWALQMITTTCTAANTSIGAVIKSDGFTGKLPIVGAISLSQGFLLISLILSSTMVYIMEREFLKASVWTFLGALLSMVGMIHAYDLSPQGGVINIFGLAAAPKIAFGYFITAIILVLLHFFILDEEDVLEMNLPVSEDGSPITKAVGSSTDVSNKKTDEVNPDMSLPNPTMSPRRSSMLKTFLAESHSGTSETFASSVRQTKVFSNPTYRASVVDKRRNNKVVSSASGPASATERSGLVQASKGSRKSTRNQVSYDSLADSNSTFSDISKSSTHYTSTTPSSTTAL